jgi:hypothetical protein
MRSPGSLCDLVAHLLPAAGRCGQHAAVQLLRAMLIGFTVQLTQLARQSETDGEGSAKVRRQYFDRWLNDPRWDPAALYAGLNRRARRLLATRRHVPLLMDLTDLGEQWSVLQVSLPFERRALPLFRSVVAYQEPQVERRTRVREALAFLEKQLPGPRSRYVLVADRGFPGHWLIRQLQQSNWRFVLRLTRRWKVTHPDYTGELMAAVDVPGLVGPRPRCLARAVFGRRGKGADEWCEAHLVLVHEAGRKEPWYLITSERRAPRAVAIYRERMQIECEFRDVKGPLGLDTLQRWHHRERVARLLGMVAAYEWRLALLWLRHRLGRYREQFTKYGRLSWIRLTREWIQLKLREAALPALARL